MNRLLILIFVLSVACMGQQIGKFSFVELILDDTLNNRHDTLDIYYNQENDCLEIKNTFTLSEAAYEFFHFVKGYVGEHYIILPKSEWELKNYVGETKKMRFQYYRRKD